MLVKSKNTSNFRDGSIGSMKKNKLFRSAKLSNLEDEDLDILEQNKIFKIIDLRDPVEIEKAPDNLSSNLLKKYINLPISANTLSRMADAYHNCNFQENETIYENVMKKSYEFYLKNHSEVWKKFFTILLESNGKPVIYHCSAGKDRTGIASYLIQSLCSQKEELIFDNYLLSNQLLNQRYATAEQKYTLKRNKKMTDLMLKVIGQVKLDYLKNSITFIKKEYGSNENYFLKKLNFSEKDLKNIKHIYS